MAGLWIREARFDGGFPTFAQVVDRAQSLGGLALRLENGRVLFADLPEMYVVMSCPEGRPDRIQLWDYSQDNPAVMLLIEHALVSLGGRMDPPPKPLPLPLTIDFVRRDRRRKHWILRAGCLVFSVVALALAIGMAWIAWISLRALFAG
jgi:hypothetical protein